MLKDYYSSGGRKVGVARIGWGSQRKGRKKRVGSQRKGGKEVVEVSKEGWQKSSGSRK